MEAKTVESIGGIQDDANTNPPKVSEEKKDSPKKPDEEDFSGQILSFPPFINTWAYRGPAPCINIYFLIKIHGS